MKHTLYAMIVSGLAFGLASCGLVLKSDDPNPPEVPKPDNTEAVESPAGEEPAEEKPTTPAESPNTSEVAKQLAGKLVKVDTGSNSFVEAQLDSSIEYYLVSYSASW